MVRDHGGKLSVDLKVMLNDKIMLKKICLKKWLPSYGGPNRVFANPDIWAMIST